MTTRPPADTHDRGQRGSRPVLFDPACELWRGAADGLIVSDDLNARLEFEPPEVAAAAAAAARAAARTMPPPAAALLPFQRQEPSLAATMRSPWASPRTASPPPPGPPPPPARPARPVPTRRPLVDVANVQVLAREVRALEQENALLRKHAALQDKVIAGMCNLQVFERENLPPHVRAAWHGAGPAPP